MPAAKEMVGLSDEVRTVSSLALLSSVSPSHANHHQSPISRNYCRIEESFRSSDKSENRANRPTVPHHHCPHPPPFFDLLHNHNKHARVCVWVCAATDKNRPQPQICVSYG
jgi:hypothetical protein